MALNLQAKPASYLITSGATIQSSTPDSEDFQRLLLLAAAAVKARVSFIQLREKNLSARTLFQLTAQASIITRGSRTRLLVNDRADIAAAAGADGVHLTTRSLSASVVRRTFGPSMLIGVSTHTLDEALTAREDGADFAVFGPVFETPSKSAYGPPAGLEKLSEVAHALKPFPILALGGIKPENTPHVLAAGASGIAGIRLFGDAQAIRKTMAALRY
jgi:thiamine-phosphate pyrophosphorylase